MKKPFQYVGTTHDPHGRLTPLVETFFPLVQERFSSCIVALTNTSHESLLTAFKRLNAMVVESDVAFQGMSYWTALKESERRKSAHPIFLCDLDRILHWISRYPNELDEFLSHDFSPHEWVVLGRTERAYRTHHEPLFATEHIFRTLLGKLYPQEQSIDYLSSAALLSQDTISWLNAHLRKKDAGWYGEHVALLLKRGIVPAYQECEGLEWETPDRFQDEIKKCGSLDAWRGRLNTDPLEWKLRVKLLGEFIDGALSAQL